MTTRTETVVAPGIGVSMGYFMIWYLVNRKGYVFADVPMATAMAGGLFSYIVFEIRKGFTWVVSRYESKSKSEGD